MPKSTEEKTYDLSRKVREAQKKETFTPYVEAVRGTQRHDRYLTVERNGEKKLTLMGYYNEHLLGIQNERKLEEATCKRYDNVVCTLVAPAFADYALEEMDELDYLECWKKVRKSAEHVTDLQTAYTMVRMIADYAYHHGGTELSLWGLMTEDGESFLKARKSESASVQMREREEIRRFVSKGIKIACSLTLVTEFKLFLQMINCVSIFGQVLAGLIIFATGARTSEAIAFQFKHLTEIAPGYWALQRINVSAPEARESVIGGKTHNAFRVLWLPKFLAKIILDRRDHLLTIYSEEEVENLTIACYGTDYCRPCTQKELNAHMKALFKKVGVKEDIIASAFESMSETEEIQRKYERSIVAYLGRHQAITAMIYCGLTEAQICACAGHEQIDGDVETYDFVNPDTFKELANALSRRPIFQIFDQMSEYYEVSYEGGIKTFSSDGWAKIGFSSDKDVEFLLCAYSVEANVPLEIGKTTRIRIGSKENLCFPKRKDERILSIRRELRAVGEKAYLTAKEDIENAAGKDGSCAADDTEWLEQTANSDVRVHTVDTPEIAPLPDVQGLLPKMVVSKVERTNSTDAQEPNEAVEVRLTEEENLMKEVQRKLKMERMVVPPRYAVSDTRLYVLDQQGELVEMHDEQRKLFNRGTRGKKVLREKQEAVMLYAYCPEKTAYLISKQGWIYHIPAGSLFADSETHSTALHMDVLRNQGILLQDANLTQAGASLVCLTAEGEIIRLAVNKLSGTFPVQGRPLIHPEIAAELGVEVVSACVCPKGKDILLITKNGKALRIADEDISVRNSFSLKPIKGISLNAGDRAVSCVPYTDEGILSITADGVGMLFQGKTDINPHGRGTGGVAFVRLRDGDRVVNAMLSEQVVAMLRKDGYLCCAAVNQFPGREKNAMGVDAMSTEREKHVVSAITLPL